ncbi:hypothetical protein C0991_012031 [Blastosporella zonata]|nr:hypothetical protein C0991_012031 [Blastosporella zonata]
MFLLNTGKNLDGSVFYSTINNPNVTFQSGSHDDVRIQFLDNGRLPNIQDTTPRAIEDGWPVFGLSHDLGEISRPTSPIVFSIGHVRDPAIEYTLPGGKTQQRSLYFWSHFSTVADVISFFLEDYPFAFSRAQRFDAKVNRDAGTISADYAGIVALSMRQAIGATEITISKTSHGAWNTSDVLVFLKVDAIFPTWPVFLYLNPALGKYLLEGIFRYQANDLHPQNWSVRDLGVLRPARSGALLDRWTQTLINDSLFPGYQLSTDDSFIGHLANQTNLAIKGIIGIKAMSQISHIIGDEKKSGRYSVGQL